MNFFKKTWSILYSIDKKNIIRIQLLFILLIISLFLETLSITLIIPILAFFFSDSSTNLGFLNYFLNMNSSLMIALIIFSSIIIIKNVFNIFLGYYRTKFTFNTQINISKSIFDKILRGTFNKFISHGSAMYIRNIFQEPNIFASGYLNPLLIVISELFLVLGVIIIISVVEPILFIYLIFFSGIILFIFFKIIKNKIRELGKNRQKAELKRLREVNNAFDSFQVTKIFNLENFYMNRYNSHSGKVIRAGVINETIANIPRFFLELLMIIMIILIIIYLKFILKLEDQETLIIISLYGYAAFRIFPSINRIMVNIQNIQFSSSTFELIHNLVFEKNNILKKDTTIEDFKDTLKFENICFSYGGQKILKNINLEIKKNNILGISGVSGSGKTTLLNIISGLLNLDKGSVLIDGVAIDLNKTNLTGLFSYVPQNNLLIDGSLVDNIALGQENNELDIIKINKILKILNLDKLINSFPDKLYTDVGKNGAKLSGGQAQRICIARALYFDRKILILDEPTSSLDKENEEEILDYLKKLKSELSIIIVSHKQKTFEFCDQLLEI